MNFKKIILEQFLSLSTAYNCMCYSSNGNYDSFKYQARSTNTLLLLHIKKKYEFRKKALTHYISNMLKIWRKLTKWTFISTCTPPPPPGSIPMDLGYSWFFLIEFFLCNTLSRFIPPLHRLGYWRLANSPISPYICHGLKGNVKRSFSNQNVYI